MEDRNGYPAQVLAERARTRPDDVYLLFDDNRITYRQLNERVNRLANGLRKLGEMTAVPDHPDQLAFPCGQSHDELVGLLLPRALNVRAILREEEEASTRGLLVAPSQQK